MGSDRDVVALPVADNVSTFRGDRVEGLDVGEDGEPVWSRLAGVVAALPALPFDQLVFDRGDEALAGGLGSRVRVVLRVAALVAAVVAALLAWVVSPRACRG
jgi:hypothetical protein